jgi:anti-sigma regulatory factor (Ser/Thr protein kinase)
MAPARFEVSDSSGVAPTRRALAILAKQLAFSEEDSGRASLVATELATNLVRHTTGGEIIMRAAADALEIIAWDRGPGMRDTARSIADGFSTAGGAGTGLGAVHRLADDVELNSTAPGGTVIVAKLRRRADPQSANAPLEQDAGPRYVGQAAGLVLAVAPEVVSGDAWGVVSSRNGDTVMLADGLGHGPGAAEASELAVAALRPGEPVEETLERVHDALRPTRGAAVAVAQVDRLAGVVHFAGVGNISAEICAQASSRSLASMSGTAGRQVRTLRSFQYELPESGFLVMHSDGCRSGWSLYSDPQLRRRSPLMIAATLIRDWERGRDDVSVVVLPLAADAGE